MKKVFGIAAALGALALPLASFAQPYAYVNSTGDVNMVEADSADAALMTAPNIDMHSGVMLLSSTDDDVLDQGVSVQ